MAFTTANDLITKAFQVVQGLNASEVMPTADLNNALDILNAFVDYLCANDLMTTAQVEGSFSLTASKSAYTVGSGGDYNTTKPFSVLSSYLTDSNSQIYPVDIVTRETFQSYNDRELTSNTGIPEVLFYDAGATQQTTQLGTINLYPTPDGNSTYTLYVEQEKPFTEFTALSSSITFPQAYKEMLLWNFCLRLYEFYGQPPSPGVVRLADETMRAIESINVQNKQVRVGFSFPGQKTRAYNILSGTDL